jgi:hypothetical protein
MKAGSQTFTRYFLQLCLYKIFYTVPARKWHGTPVSATLPSYLPRAWRTGNKNFPSGISSGPITEHEVPTGERQFGVATVRVIS